MESNGKESDEHRHESGPSDRHRQQTVADLDLDPKGQQLTADPVGLSLTDKGAGNGVNRPPINATSSEASIELPSVRHQALRRDVAPGSSEEGSESLARGAASAAVRTGPRLTSLDQVAMKPPPAADASLSASAANDNIGAPRPSAAATAQADPTTSAVDNTAPKADPRAFMAQLKSELPAALMRSVSGLLGQYTKDKATQAFIEGIAQLLKGPSTVHLLQVSARGGHGVGEAAVRGIMTG